MPSSTDIESIWYLLAAYPDERDLAARADVLTFRTDWLEDPITFAGQPILEAEISFASPSTHVFAKLQDVEPDGTTRPISWARAVLTKATGGAVRLTMDDNAYRVRRGHALQLQIQSSDFPHWVVHPGTDQNPWTTSEKIPAGQSIRLGGVSGAKLTVPTIKLD